MSSTASQKDFGCPLLALISPAFEFNGLREILRQGSYEVHETFSLRQVLGVAESDPRFPVLITTPSFGDGDWRAILSHLESIPTRPELILLTDGPDPKVWADVIGNGGYDVVASPYREADVLRTVDNARRRWERHREILNARQSNCFTSQRLHDESPR